MRLHGIDRLAPFAFAGVLIAGLAGFVAPVAALERGVTIVSEGVRLHGTLFYREVDEGKKLPTVIMAHGWGGVAGNFRDDAEALAEAGYLVLTFDYRGWGESDSRVILTGPEPGRGGNDRFAAEDQAIRGYIDPFEQVEDWFNAIAWATAEPMVDAARIGLRGSSFSGGYVVYVAGRDPRIKAIVSQVPSIAARPAAPIATSGGLAQQFRENAVAMARGLSGYPPPSATVIGSLRGAPIGDKLLRWWPNEEAPYVRAAALFILAGNEELFDNKVNGELAYARVPGAKKLVVIPDIRHYEIYGSRRAEAIKLAIDWFDRYLKP
jgi:uncharacterized protein